MIKTDGIDHVVLFVKGCERAKKFYNDVLGMTVHREQPIGGFLNAGPGHLLALFQKERLHSWDEGRSRYHDARDVIGGSEFNRVSLTTDSGTRQSVKAEIESKGVKVHSRSDDHEGLYIDDPDGHQLQFHVAPPEARARHH